MENQKKKKDQKNANRMQADQWVIQTSMQNHLEKIIVGLQNAPIQEKFIQSHQTKVYMVYNIIHIIQVIDQKKYVLHVSKDIK